MDKFRLIRATGAGFHMTFNNNVTISVQFGAGTYSDKGKTTAEVAVFRDENWFVLDDNEEKLVVMDGSDIMPHCTPDMVALIMDKASKIK